MSHQESHPKENPWDRPVSSNPGAHRGGVRRTPPRTHYPRPRGKSRGDRGVPWRIPTPAGGRIAGLLFERPDGLELVKRVRESKHLFRMADAWGIDLRQAEEARAEGVRRIRLDETERGICYSVSPDYLLAHGFRRDFGHGLQVFLPRSQWAQVDGAQLQLLPG